MSDAEKAVRAHPWFRRLGESDGRYFVLYKDADSFPAIVWHADKDIAFQMALENILRHQLRL